MEAKHPLKLGTLVRVRADGTVGKVADRYASRHDWHYDVVGPGVELPGPGDNPLPADVDVESFSQDDLEVVQVPGPVRHAAGPASAIVLDLLVANEDRLDEYLARGGDETHYLDGKAFALNAAFEKLREAGL